MQPRRAARRGLKIWFWRVASPAVGEEGGPSDFARSCALETAEMPKTILVVDDSPTAVMIMKMTLELHQFDVVSARDGVEALAKLNAGLRPDVVLTDINMPNMNGFEFIERLKKLPGLASTPVLTMTTESSIARREQVRGLGAAGWLVKPISAPDLLAALNRVQRREDGTLAAPR